MSSRCGVPDICFGDLSDGRHFGKSVIGTRSHMCEVYVCIHAQV